jgi:hypothetical protein
MEPSIKIISRLEGSETPYWSVGEKTYYKLIVNNKKCHFSYRDDGTCMLFVDGYKKPGLDVDNAIYDNKESEKLFHIRALDLDNLIVKAIKDWELKKDLSSSTLRTFEDIINEL